MGWEGRSLALHGTSICQHEKAVLAWGDSEQGNDLAEEMKKKKRKEGKKKRGRRVARGGWDGERGGGRQWRQPLAPCVSRMGIFVFVALGL